VCGICGVISADAPAAERRVRNMMQALAHRGPDDKGMLTQPGVVFGVRRLSIIDLSGGRQPVFNETGDVGVVFNGEIYNFPQLRVELENRGHAFRTRSDTEVIVHAYEEWGDRCVEHFHGMFAFAIWDGRNAAPNSFRRGRVFLARDRLGIKPLYYALVERAIYFASELRALLASDAIERRLSLEALEGYLLFGSVVEPATLIEGVHSLPPGHSLTLNLDTPFSPEPRAYWDLCVRAHQIQDAPRTLPSAAREVRTLLDRSVTEQLVADVPVGVFLSSGLDSTALAAIAARQSRDIHTFTLSFQEQEFDEAAAAREIARQLGTRHQELLLTSDEMQSRLFEAVEALDQPSMDGVNTFFVSWAARQAGLKVALSGLGGDELFGGYPSFRATPRLAKLLAIARRLPGTARQAISEALLAMGRRGTDPRRADRLRKIAALFSHPEAFPHAYFVSRMLFTPAQTNRLLPPSILSTHRQAARPETATSWQLSLEELVRRAETLPGQSTTSYLELHTYMLNTLLRDTDSVSMRHSLEVRVPFLDHRLVEFIAALPDSAKKGATPKALLVESVRDLVPVEALNHAKRTFTLPWEHWLRGKLGVEVASRLNALTPSLALVLDGEMAKTVWRQFLRGRTNWARPWSLFVLNEWVRKHIDEAESCAARSAASGAEAAAS
jgi:asparagine synthase (glutamine-hydrolysing)